MSDLSPSSIPRVNPPLRKKRRVKKLHLDFETYSPLSVKVVGSYKYAEHPDTEVLLIGYAFDDDPIKCIFYPDESERQEFHTDVIDEIIRSQTDEDYPYEIIICAHNYQMERNIWNGPGIKKYGWPTIDNRNWDCTSLRARAVGLPGGLDGAGKSLNVEIEKQAEGARLIKQYCLGENPPSLANHPTDMVKFKSYCSDDVAVERELDKRLPDIHPTEREIFMLDMLINDRGIPINTKFLSKASRLMQDLMEHYEKEAIRITGYKASQNARMLEWFSKKGLELPNLQAKTVEDSLKLSDLDDEVKRVLEIRYDASRAGPKKLPTIQTIICNDGTVKGSFIYHGATTGRWTAVQLQPQNFGKESFEKQFALYEAVLAAESYQDLLKAYPRPLDEMSKALRSVIMAPDGKILIAADYSSIEARVLAWLAGETWLIEAFARGEDAYVKMAAMIFNKPEDEINGDERFVGKQLVLGCGYSMSGKRFRERCMDFGVEFTLKQANHFVSLYRKSVPNIVKLWTRYGKAAVMACQDKYRGKAIRVGQVKFRKEDELVPGVYSDYFYLTMQLPSGRKLHYQDPGIRGSNVRFNKYIGKTKFSGNLYGGFITQNITQAIARDLLANGIIKVSHAGYPVVMHIHDDICSMINERDMDGDELVEFERLMCDVPAWANGCPVDAEGWTSQLWRK